MNKLVVTSFCCLLHLFSSLAIAETPQKMIYSSEVYCILQAENVNDEFLNSYASKLGYVPQPNVCRRIARIIREFQPEQWDYRFGRPYPGSAVRLPQKLIKKIKEAKALLKQVEQEARNKARKPY